MAFEIGGVYHGFKLLEERPLREIGSTGRLFEHVKSGARLMSLANDDPNKVFCIGFRTPPSDDTGVPHILEHSVLCGSRKFPSKEPFVELAKGSLNTFLNAMTYPDKTIYPVASKNAKDFENLMEVYLDAVLHPRIYEKPEILMQEGWHYELPEKDAPLGCKGVVYNEMKGAFSSPERMLVTELQRSLYPDTTYGCVSGGHPDSIPELTHEAFLGFHRRFYHPSNSYIFLYGDGDLAAQLGFLDARHLYEFDRSPADSAIQEQAAFDSPREAESSYPLSSEDDGKGKSFLSLGWVCGKAADPELYTALEILQSMLLDMPGAPLKEALIKAGVGQDVVGYCNSSILQPMFGVIVKYSDPEKRERFLSVVDETLRRLASEGLDRDLVEAGLNSTEFYMREAEHAGLPKGLFYGIVAFDSWLYDADPFVHLAFDATFRRIREAAGKGGFFEGIIKDLLLDNDHRSCVLLRPEPGLLEKQEGALSDVLAGKKAAMSDAQLQALVAETARLKELQAAPDSPEVLAKIPLLSIEDIDPESERLPLTETELAGARTLHHDLATNGILYLTLLFDTSGVPQDRLQHLALLSGVLGKLGTRERSYADLSKQINIHTGGLSFGTEIFPEPEDESRFHPKLALRAKALVPRAGKLAALAGEILTGSVFSDKERLLEVLRELKSDLEVRIKSSGHVLSKQRLFSYFSGPGKYEELVRGVSFYRFVADLEKEFSLRSDETVRVLEELARSVFVQDKLVLSATVSAQDLEKVRAELGSLTSALPRGGGAPAGYRFELVKKNEGLMTPSQVQYVAKGYNYRRLGFPYTGKLAVLRTIVGLDHLWNKVRVQGGAYGAFMVVDRGGSLAFLSYRDPNIEKTLEAYHGTVGYLKDFSPDAREMAKYIIGTVGKMDRHLTPWEKGDLAAREFLMGLTHADIQKERDDVLSTTPEDIRSLAGMVEQVLAQDHLCVLGSEGRIKETEGVFASKETVFS